MTFSKDETLVFQYRAIERLDKNHTIENLASKQLYFKDPVTFDDLNDCSVWLDESGTEDQWANLIMKGHRARNVDCTQDKAKKLLANYLARGNFTKDGDIYTLVRNKRNDEEQEINGYRGDIDKLPRVCCFSGVYDNIKMWEEHADNHKGICLCYSPVESQDPSYEMIIKTLKNTDCPLYEVKYVPKSKLEEYKVNIFDSYRHIKAHKRLCLKSVDYTYEQEYRIIYSDTVLENNILNYQEGDLKGIIFGLKIDPEDAKLVYETVKENYPPESVKFYRLIGTLEDRVIIDPNPIPDIDKYIQRKSTIKRTHLI
jgi:hypothetical protein